VLIAISQGLIFGLVALGVFLTYRVLNFADLTVDGSFTSGAASAGLAIYFLDWNPWLATASGLVVGALAGLLTGLLHAVLKIEPLLASILIMIALYSINLRIMRGPNISMGLRDGERLTTVFSPLKERGLLGSWQTVAILVVVAMIFKLVVDWFLHTNFGLGVQSTGDNPRMASAMGVSTDLAKIVTLMLSNALVGLAGAIYAQFAGSADAQMGVGMILVGLASVIVGNAIFPIRLAFFSTLGVLVGSVLYRLVILWALMIPIFNAQDMKLISAVLVVIALVVSQSKTLRGFFSKFVGWRARQVPDDSLPEIPRAVS